MNGPADAHLQAPITARRELIAERRQSSQRPTAESGQTVADWAAVCLSDFERRLAKRTTHVDHRNLETIAR